MIYNFIEQAVNSAPQTQRYVTCVFTTLATIWLSVTGYYYFIEEFTACKGAFITGGVFFILALSNKAWEFYIKRKIQRQHSFNELIVKVFPLLIPTMLSIFKNKTTRRQPLKLFTLITVSLLIIYYIVNKKNDSND